MWGKRGHRGDALEELLYYTNQYYHQLGLCRVDKVSTPIKVVEIDHQGMVTKGFFEKKSTVDFIGIVQGVCIAFDAKETNLKSLPLLNIHTHQLEYMRDINKQGGLAFIIIHFKFNDSFYLVPFELIESYFENSRENSRRSIPYKAMDARFEIKKERSGSILNYLETLNAYVKYKSELEVKHDCTNH
ncbi:MAG TPA: Holliday junction resolvase RecU [Clostridiales bacterium UBA8960]|nr:Holliday junction resolvase RecU [Clostridiales bacterium UBA8960]